MSAYCKEHRSDGICDEQCNQEGCDFDGGDCQGISNKIVSFALFLCKSVSVIFFSEANSIFFQLSGELSVVVLVDPSYFVANAPRFLRSISKMLRAEVRVKRDQKGLMIFLWKDGKVGERIEISQMVHIRKLSKKIVI